MVELECIQYCFYVIYDDSFLVVELVNILEKLVYNLKEVKLAYNHQVV